MFALAQPDKWVKFRLSTASAFRSVEVCCAIHLPKKGIRELQED